MSRRGINSDAELWDRIRQIIEHEDELISHRLTWYLQLNGFLFAAFALLLAKDVQDEITRAAAIVFVVAGIGSAWIVLQGTAAAFDAITYREMEFSELVAKCAGGKSQLPSIMAQSQHVKRGLSPGLLLPLAMCGTWLVLATVATEFNWFVEIVASVVFIWMATTVSLVIKTRSCELAKVPPLEAPTHGTPSSADEQTPT